jgi:surface antigen
MHFGLQVSLGRPFGVSARSLALWLMVLTSSLTYLGAGAADRAQAADTPVLCAGYSGCSASPFTTHGYEAHADISWWSMYAGDNCTNYVAYVESQVYGVRTPAYLLGDAYQWSSNAAAHGVVVDSTPSVGSVADWDADTPGTGGYGHVAVVERVGPGGSYIDVSESGMGTSTDGYDWERIYPDQSSWDPWPSDFIHFTGTAVPVAIPQAGKRIGGAEIALPGT